ncbi:MAG: PAS domain-containing protein [Candidatus Woykebacteria bacterium]
MDDHQDHEDLIKNLTKEYSAILESSSQGIYIYLDDNHKLCNEKFAQMLGYSVEEWSKPSEFIETYVAKESGERLVSAFQDAMEKSMASEIDVTWKKKDSSTVETDVILVPISFEGHHFALHFVTSD